MAKQKGSRKHGRNKKSPSMKGYEIRKVANKRRKMLKAYVKSKCKNEELANRFKGLFGKSIEEYLK